MSEETPEETRPGTVGDEQLPEDLRPTEDNPLAQPLPDGETADLGIEEAGGLSGGADGDGDDDGDGDGGEPEEGEEGDDPGGHS
jgi:hypothetical protein